VSIRGYYSCAFAVTGTAKVDKADWDGAIADASKAIELNPSSAIAYAARAGARGKKGDYDGAIADCNRALKLDVRPHPSPVGTFVYVRLS
jgi:tetratricopeptide (TPR) repeat protein